MAISKPIDINLVMSDSVQSRFWSKVDKSAGADGCWVWTAGKHDAGYGSFMVKKELGDFLAHRISYSIFYGADPGQLFVCHHCDNRICCNPNHLFLGTDQDNKDDMVSKGRQGAARGVDSAKAKFSAGEILKIRERYAAGGITCLEIAVANNVDETTISGIVRGDTYTLIGGPLSDPKSLCRGETHPCAYLTVDKVRQIRALRAAGHTLKGIGQIVGATKDAVYDVIRGKTWKHVA